jgi:lipopolysaccharide transport system ATP-binding protein
MDLLPDLPEAHDFENGNVIMSETLIEVQGLSKKFCRNFRRSLWYGVHEVGRELTGRPPLTTLRKQEFWALQDVSFEVKRGECIGLLGRNGAGKTTLLKLLNGLLKPATGKIKMKGKVSALIALGAGFNPILSGRENIFVSGAILGLSREELRRKEEEIIEFAELREYIDSPVQNYSSGMQMRLGFSIATAVEPDVLLLDEVLAVGDMAFRAKCFQRIGNLLKDTAVVFVSHDLVQVSRICNSVLVLQEGKTCYSGPTEEGMEYYVDQVSSKEKISSTEALAREIKNCKVTLEKNELKSGESLNVRLTIQSQKRFAPGLCLAALSSHETFFAQSEFTQLLPEIREGETICHISIGPLHLRKEKYSLCITILDETRKATLVHQINVVDFTVTGARGYGVAYQVPVKAGNPS